MESREIAPNIYWVGFVDWDVRDFHGYRTQRGSTYNAYLIVDERVALIDAVKSGHGGELLEHVAQWVDPGRIDYVISNHTEPDHSGEIGQILARAPQAEVVCSAKGREGLSRYYSGDWKFRVVQTGNKLSLGKYELEFIMTPMLHWPDSMFTYLPAEKILFSMDAFGQHLASSGRFDTENDLGVVMAEAKTYYANIIMHLGKLVQRTLKQAEGLDIRMICPSHGVIWTKHIPEIVAAYRDWAVCKPRRKVLVIYDSMWHSTELMAEQIARGAAAEGVEVKLLRIPRTDVTVLATEVLDAGALAVGSPTLNNHLMPTVAGFLTYLKGLRPADKLGLAFGSHGWSGGGAAQVGQMLRETGVELVADDIVCRYRPDTEEKRRCYEAGRELARRVKAHLTN